MYDVYIIWIGWDKQKYISWCGNNCFLINLCNMYTYISKWSDKYLGTNSKFWLKPLFSSNKQPNWQLPWTEVPIPCLRGQTEITIPPKSILPPSQSRGDVIDLQTCKKNCTTSRHVTSKYTHMKPEPGRGHKFRLRKDRVVSINDPSLEVGSVHSPITLALSRFPKPLDYAAHYFSLIGANHLPYLYGTRFVLVNRVFNQTKLSKKYTFVGSHCWRSCALARALQYPGAPRHG